MPESRKHFRWLPWVILSTALAGFVDASYLTVEHYRGVGVGCSIIHGCDTVLTSQYAEVFGIPTALLGAFFYLSITVLCIIYLDGRNGIVLRVLAWLTVPGMAVTAVLVYLQGVVIGAWCQYCLVSAVTSTLLFVMGMYILKNSSSIAQSRRRLVMATGNAGKVREMRHIFSDMGIDILSAREAGVDSEAVEDGTTLKQNALKKARHVARQVTDWVVADDTGLFVDALQGAPGVYSARHAGVGASDDAIRDKVLRDMANIASKDRTARFISAVAAVGPAGQESVFIGTLRGRINTTPAGEARPHLPYDQIFIPEGSTKTLAEMSDDEKNSISHRRIAFDQLRAFLKKEFTD